MSAPPSPPLEAAEPPDPVAAGQSWMTRTGVQVLVVEAVTLLGLFLFQQYFGR